MQSSVEYDMLQIINEQASAEKSGEDTGTLQYQLKKEMNTIGSRLKNSLLALDTVSLYIRYDLSYVYSCDGKENEIDDALFTNLVSGRKQYIIRCEENRYAVYVTSCSSIEEKNLYVLTKMDITENYEMLAEQIRYFKITVFFALLILGIFTYLASRYLTKPLEQLSEASAQIAGGNYSGRIQTKSRDEVGLLAEQFNVMAAAMEEHIDTLKGMIAGREQFVADFTHEIKTPMTTIIGYADTLRSMELSRQEQLTALNYIFSEGKRLENLSGKLFELLYVKKQVIERTLVPIGEFVREVEEITLPLLQKKQIEFLVNVEERCLWINRELFVTVFVNLIDNARKASDTGGKILLDGRVCRENHCYELVLTDFGIGMSEEEQKSMWDEFYMADKSRARKEGGAGLGMSLVKMILERHEAVCSVESEPGAGTKIKIQLKEKP
jgi:signal transduction histidine kinase